MQFIRASNRFVVGLGARCLARSAFGSYQAVETGAGVCREVREYREERES